MSGGVRVEVEFAIIPEWLLYADVSAQAIRVYGVLARRANYRTKRAFPSHKEIAERSRCSVATARRALGELEDLGAIDVNPRSDQRGRTSNEYVVKVSRPLLMGEQAPLPIDEQATSLTGEQGPLATGERRNESHEERDVEPEEPESLPQAEPTADELYTEEFEAFWAVFPMRKDKRKAAIAYKKARKRASRAAIMAGVERYVLELQRHPELKIKFGEGWLNGDRWLDEPEPERVPDAGGMTNDQFLERLKARSA